MGVPAQLEVGIRRAGSVEGVGVEEYVGLDMGIWRVLL